MRFVWILAVLMPLAVSANESPQTLVINTNSSEISSKASFAKIVAAFEAENPDLRIELNVFDLAAYSASFAKFIVDAPPDVASGVSITHLRRFSTEGLLSSLSDLDDDPNAAALRYLSSATTTGLAGNYALPTTVYPWGFLLRKDLMAAMELAAPQDFPQLLAYCRAARENGVIPIALGSNLLWTVAAWFDYINLRINGQAFHRQVVAAQIDFTDPRIVAVFGMWRQLLDANCFSENHEALTWKDAFTQLRKAEAGMQLIGSFALSNLDDEQLVFAPFPMLTPGLEQTLVAPVDTLVIPAKAKNRAGALRFLRFMMQADIQSELASARGHWPANRGAPAAAQSAARQSALDLIVEAPGLVQFFDRETPAHFAKAAMMGFREFLLSPDDLGVILQRIEASRQAMIES